MRRRDVIPLLGVTLAWPLAAHARQTVPVIGFLHSGSPASYTHLVAAFREGLKQGGYIEGQSVFIEYRWAEDRYERLPALAADLLGRGLAVLVGAGGPYGALAAKSATSTVPVIFTGVTDPVRTGLVASFNNPGGNVTGIAGLTTELDPKRLELLIELAPTADVIGVLANAGRPHLETQLQTVQQAAAAIGKTIVVFRVSSEAELATALTSAAEQRIRALLVTADPFFNNRRERLAALLNQVRIPAIFGLRDIVNAGGLMSYGPNNAGIYRDAGLYAARILRGAKPSELPIAQPTKIDIVINLKAAQAQGIEVPQSLLARADEVIE